MRLIDADALIEQKFKNPISYNAFVNIVKRQPTVDTMKHGYYIKIQKGERGYSSGDFRCSVCGRANPCFHMVTDYCPRCGARMDDTSYGQTTLWEGENEQTD